MSVGLILVSHSADLAKGSAELARQMAPTVIISPAGGTDDGGIGTSFDAISAAMRTAETGSGAVLLYDLGSALLTAETALEFLDPEVAQRIRIVDAPLVEGAVAAAVTSEEAVTSTRWRPRPAAPERARMPIRRFPTNADRPTTLRPRAPASRRRCRSSTRSDCTPDPWPP